MSTIVSLSALAIFSHISSLKVPDFWGEFAEPRGFDHVEGALRIAVVSHFCR